MNRKGGDKSQRKGGTNDKPKKAKGHRQKGSGTVAVSKGEHTRQGILCKEWQKTPMQLLSEYCQSKKRNKPYYHKAQSYDSLDAAKHHAALLALHYLEPLLPYERKLPDYYRDVWLFLTSSAKEEPSSNSKTTKSSVGKVETKKPKNLKTLQAAAQNGSELDFWSETPSIVEDNAEDQVAKKDQAIELFADRKFASHSELQQHRLERQAERNKKNRKHENRRRANPLAQVFMGTKCRTVIENILNELSGKEHQQNGEAATQRKWEADDALSKRILEMGFDDKQTNTALRYASQNAESQDDLLSAALDWLCLNVPEGKVPQSFNPQGTQLDVIMPTKRFSHPQATVIQRLMHLGYVREDCVHALHECALTNDTNLSHDHIEYLALRQLHQKLMDHLKIHEVPYVDDPSELDMLRDDEIMALEAIYPDTFFHEKVSYGNTEVLNLRIVLDDIESVSGITCLEVLIDSKSTYPHGYPTIRLSNPDLDPTALLPVLCALVLECTQVQGEPMLYHLGDWVRSNLSKEMRSHHGMRLYKPLKPSLPPSTSPPPAPVVKKRDKKPVQQSNSNHRPARLNQERKNAISTKLLESYQSKLASDTKYQAMISARAKLPAHNSKAEFLEMLQNNQVIVCGGQTGCGKSTQLPQFILDDFVRKGKAGECNIICTQPRRIAAIGVAMRIADERAESIGDTVGYQIRMETKKSGSTRLLFCTTGILLRRLLNDRQLEGVTHVVVDEVHERNVDTDFLLSILRGLINTRRDLKIVLMSATMNAQLFVDYFSKGSDTNRHCPILSIPGFTYPVTTHYLEDILRMTNYVPPKNMLREKKVKDKDLVNYDRVAATLKCLDEDKMDYQMLASLVQYIVSQNGIYGSTGDAILIFMTGVMEIKKTIDAISSLPKSISAGLFVLPLHGGLTPSEQARVFQKPPAGKRKIVVSTNVAETSLTIDDVVVVIDRGRVKEMRYDATNRMSLLVDTWTSRASANQRKGRAGRVQKGHCFRVYSKRVEEKEMPADQPPEILRVSLEHICLQIKLLNLGSIQAFLSQVIEPPSAEATNTAVSLLTQIGALNADESLSPLGYHIAALPIDARIAKFVLFGSILKCVDPVLTIAAGLSSRSPFLASTSMQDSVEAVKKKLSGGNSDHLVLLRAYEGWRDALNRRQYCRDNCLSYEGLENIHALRKQFAQDLESIGFLGVASTKSKQNGKHGELAPELNVNSSRPRVIKAALTAGLYSNVIRVEYPEERYLDTAQGAISGGSPAKLLKFFIRKSSGETERIFLHPSSVNFKQNRYGTPWLVYNDLVKTSRVFVRESSMVAPYALLLFGGDIEIQHEQGTLTIDGWIRFNAVARIAVLVKSIRKELDYLLQQKIEDPRLDLTQSTLIDAISHLLISEGL